MQNDKLNSNSGEYGGLPLRIKHISATVGEFAVNADTVSGDKTMTLDSEAEIFVGSLVSGPGIVPGTRVASINTGTAASNVTSVELDTAATATATDIGTIHLNGTELLASDSGSVILVPDLDADHHFVLPSVAPGLSFEFWYTGTAADASDWEIKTQSSSEYFMGGLVFHDTDSTDTNAVVDSDNDSNSHLKILTPIGGTRVCLLSDGALWYVTGAVISATDTAVVFADNA